MGAIRAFSVMSDALGRNPIVFGGAAIVGVGGTVLNTVSQIPLVGLLFGLLYFFLEPLLAGGFLGMANEAVSGETDLGDFWSSAQENYTDLLLARLLVAIPTIVYVFVVAIVGAFVIGFGMMNAVGTGPGTGGGSGLSPEAFGIAAIAVFGVAFLVFAIPFFLLQFYPAAIVVGDADATESFKYSFLLVKQNLLSALGYTAVAFVLGLLLIVPTLLGGGGQLVGQILGESAFGAGGGVVSGVIGRFAVFAVSFFVVKTLVVGVLRTYYVAFVRAVSGTV